MSQSDAPVVSIVKCQQHDSVEAVKPQVKRACDLAGGLESLIMAGDTVLIKPNLVSPIPYPSGATTNPHLVEAVVELVREAGARRVIIGDGSAVGSSTADSLEACGIDGIAKRQNCETVDFTKDDVVYVVNPLAKKMKRIRLPRSFVEANVVINMPVMKTHDAIDVSLGLKNMKGLLQVNDKKRFHKWGLAQSLVDLNQIALPELTIMDATVAMEGPGPAMGTPVDLGLVLASKDTVALDTVSATIMGYSIDELDYIRMAGEAGLGCTALDDIEIAGEPLESVIHPFERNSIARDVLNEYGIRLVARDACSGCANAITSLLTAYESAGQLGKLRDTVLLYGQSVERLDPAEMQGKSIIRVGSCTRKLVDYGYYYPGCPPFLYNMLEDLGLE